MLAAWAIACGLAAWGCGSPDDGAAPDESTVDDALTTQSCDAADTAVFFHGMGGAGRELGGPGLCVPRMSDSEFSSSIASVEAPGARVVGGYSAGRLTLLKRLASEAGHESVAIMLDPSYSDGRRFSGSTGPEIVTRWLDGDASRRFVFLYSTSSVGWREYMELTRGPHADRVRVCVLHGAHLTLPATVGRKLFVDVDAWVTERCEAP